LYFERNLNIRVSPSPIWCFLTIYSTRNFPHTLPNNTSVSEQVLSSCAPAPTFVLSSTSSTNAVMAHSFIVLQFEFMDIYQVQLYSQLKHSLVFRPVLLIVFVPSNEYPPTFNFLARAMQSLCHAMVRLTLVGPVYLQTVVLSTPSSPCAKASFDEHKISHASSTHSVSTPTSPPARFFSLCCAPTSCPSGRSQPKLGSFLHHCGKYGFFKYHRRRPCSRDSGPYVICPGRFLNPCPARFLTLFP